MTGLSHAMSFGNPPRNAYCSIGNKKVNRVDADAHTLNLPSGSGRSFGIPTISFLSNARLSSVRYTSAFGVLTRNQWLSSPPLIFVIAAATAGDLDLPERKTTPNSLFHSCFIEATPYSTPTKLTAQRSGKPLPSKTRRPSPTLLLPRN